MSVAKFWKPALIVLILFGLPALSWLFLQKGLEQRLAIMQELDSLGVAPVCLPLARDSLVAPQTWRQTSWFVAFLDERSTSETVARLLQRIYDDLAEKAPLQVLIFRAKGGENGRKVINPLSEKRWFELSLENASWKALAVEGFNWPSDDAGKPLSEMVALINEEGVILNFYNLSREEDVKKLIVHTAFINQKQ